MKEQQKWIGLCFCVLVPQVSPVAASHPVNLFILIQQEKSLLQQKTNYCYSTESNTTDTTTDTSNTAVSDSLLIRPGHCAAASMLLNPVKELFVSEGLIFITIIMSAA